MAEQTVAKLTFFGVPRMTEKERKDLAFWLESHAHDLRKAAPDDFDKRYDARFIVED